MKIFLAVLCDDCAIGQAFVLFVFLLLKCSR
jgi:hypothetical protein